ncbi:MULTISPECIES: macro domain-containing protein [unclassified Paenibacillus]|uniref:macro domain-containing protein n=1 Tax=unclassified Paenibacillus TaxID=185978 RepID=UPI0003E28C84|nr:MULTISPECIES: macro domain-containing protein [unclassified Paenibacillus]ETT41472.1 Appr-1-p processing protein [Paenibacillus sp. FSL R7-269]OMG00470.1 Appr-1-p processing protein [Paenibacillus sp. FSL R7-0337]
MAIQLVNGDLLEASEDILGHQVNCQGVMGSGIAKILRDRYPNLYPEYKKYCDQYTPDGLLGHCQLVQTGAKYTANLFGQLNYGRSKTRYTDYAALEQALTTLKTEAQAKGLSVALPYNIGCGLANGEWSVVEEMIGKVFADYEVTLYKI